METEKTDKTDYVAAIDMGSNSFHMVIGRIAQGELQLLDKLAEKVQLGAGLLTSGRLSKCSQEAALDCLVMYRQRLAGIPPGNVRVVGTNALRMAKNSSEFIERAEELLGHSVDIISGVEEARLIYLGVAHSLSDDGNSRLVIDIGGGSTEFIAGRKFEPRCMESLHLGCVTFMDRFFKGGKITRNKFDRAVLEARREVLTIQRSFEQVGWDEAVGSSGTVRSIRQVLIEHSWANEHITRKGLERLRERLLEVGHVSHVQLAGLKEDRRSIFPSGCAILLGIMQQLSLKTIRFSEGALREGLLYDQLGRVRHEDVRDRTVTALQARYHLDQHQAQQVERAALFLYDQAKSEWCLEESKYRDILQRAASLHEIGLAISHTQFHKHGGYLLKHSDLAGFSRVEQAVLSVLVRAHRRKFPMTVFDELLDAWYEPAQRLAQLLRLAVIFNRSRVESDIQSVRLAVNEENVTLSLTQAWLEERPLTLADLQQEQRYLSKVDKQLRILIQ